MFVFPLDHSPKIKHLLQNNVLKPNLLLNCYIPHESNGNSSSTPLFLWDQWPAHAFISEQSAHLRGFVFQHYNPAFRLYTFPYFQL